MSYPQARNNYCLVSSFSIVIPSLWWFFNGAELVVLSLKPLLVSFLLRLIVLFLPLFLLRDENLDSHV